MKKTILAVLAVAAMAASSYGQGTIVFQNGTANLISYNGVSATAAMGVKVQLWYAPAGTTDLNLFQALANITAVGTPLAGRFGAGTLTIPGVTPAGGTVAAIVRGFDGADWGTSLGRGQSGIFAIDTGDPTTTPAGTPTATTTLFGPINVVVPEPSSIALAGLGAASLLLFRRRK